jgi:hypothetical protein
MDVPTVLVGRTRRPGSSTRREMAVDGDLRGPLVPDPVLQLRPLPDREVVVEQLVVAVGVRVVGVAEIMSAVRAAVLDFVGAPRALGPGFIVLNGPGHVLRVDHLVPYPCGCRPPSRWKPWSSQERQHRRSHESSYLKAECLWAGFCGFLALYFSGSTVTASKAASRPRRRVGAHASVDLDGIARSTGSSCLCLKISTSVGQEADDAAVDLDAPLLSAGTPPVRSAPPGPAPRRTRRSESTGCPEAGRGNAVASRFCPWGMNAPPRPPKNGGPADRPPSSPPGVTRTTGG